MASARAAAPSIPYRPTRVPEWVVFTCVDQNFAFPLSRVREILRPRPTTRLPGCGPEVLGLTGLRGGIITVFDLGVILGGTPSSQRTDYRLLLIEHGDRLVAGAVDTVDAVARVTLEPLEEMNNTPTGPGAGSEFAIGVGEWNADAFVALDSDELLEEFLA